VQPPQAVAFSPDNTMLVSGGRERSVFIWDAKSYSMKNRIRILGGSVGVLSFSPDGRILAGALDASGMIILWDTRTWTEVRLLQGFTRRVTALAFTADGRLLAGSDVEGAVLVWDVETGKSISALLTGRILIQSLCFSRRNQTLLTDTPEGRIILWDSHAGVPLAQVVQFGAEDWIVNAADGSCDGTPRGLSFLRPPTNASTVDPRLLKEKYMERGLLKMLLGDVR